MTDRILLVEDEPRLAEMVKTYLGEAGLHVTVAGQGERGIARESARDVRAVVLDLDAARHGRARRLPAIRAGAPTPILMLTARGEPWIASSGSSWAPTIISPKPFEPRELLRAAEGDPAPCTGGASGQDVLRFGRLEIDVGARQVRLDGEERPLTSHQFDLLLALARPRRPGDVARGAHGSASSSERLEAFDRSIDVHVSRIRAAMEDDAEAAAPGHHGARRGLRLRQGSRTDARCSGSIRRSI